MPPLNSSDERVKNFEKSSKRENDENSDSFIIVDDDRSNDKKFIYEYEDGYPVKRKSNSEVKTPDECNLKLEINPEFSDFDSINEKKDRSVKKRKMFSKQENLYLVYLVQKYGRIWSTITEKFNIYFSAKRSGKDLCSKYDYIIKNKDYFEELKKKSKSISQKL